MAIKKGKKRVVITIPEERLRMIKQIAEKQNLTVSQYLVNSGTASYEEWLKSQK